MLKTFQLRVARSVTGIEVRTVALYLGISRTIISNLEFNFIKFVQLLSTRLEGSEPKSPNP